jgi:hypothetical protein
MIPISPELVIPHEVRNLLWLSGETKGEIKKGPDPTFIESGWRRSVEVEKQAVQVLTLALADC